MPPPPTYNSSQAAEISRLTVRITVTQSKRDSLLEALNHLRTQHGTQNASIAQIRIQIRNAQQEAQAALSNNRSDEYEYKLEIVAQLNWRLARSVHTWEELAGKIENKLKELSDLELELTGLERISRALRTGGN